ncbi:hypothetical protein AB0M47_04850 [Hamadaea sp. NPDC051192]|uniref:hypothetical protein n=1 Tax=Hamadaea sp. NPDC051192 TaxID=3154940 RepID=UPI0034303A31
MPIPAAVPIAGEGSDHLAELGRHARGQHLAYVAHGYPDDHDGDYRRPGFWIATLHTFTFDGAHLSTTVIPVPAGELGHKRASSYDTARSELATLLEQLGGRENGPIAVQPFLGSRSGFSVGLIAYPEYDCADIKHLGIRFSDPWDGGYDT